MSKQENITVKELIDNEQVPLGVRHWLERFAEEDKYALTTSEMNADFGTMEHARLVYDVLSSKSKETGEHRFSDAARDYIEEYLYTLAHVSDIHVWNQGALAVTALPVLLECAQGDMLIDDAGFAAVQIAVKALTTKRERGYFLRDLQEETDETKEDCDYKAAMKLSRLMADPRTPAATKNKLGATFLELAGELNIHVDHPALVERAASLTFESMDEAEYPDIAQRLYEQLHRMLDELPELPEGDK